MIFNTVTDSVINRFRKNAKGGFFRRSGRIGKCATCITVITAALITTNIKAATYNIPLDFSTIQAALDDPNVVNNDELVITPQTYVITPQTYYVNTHFNGKHLILRSTDPNNTSILTSEIVNKNISINNIYSEVRFLPAIWAWIDPSSIINKSTLINLTSNERCGFHPWRHSFERLFERGIISKSFTITEQGDYLFSIYTKTNKDSSQEQLEFYLIKLQNQQHSPPKQQYIGETVLSNNGNQFESTININPGIYKIRISLDNNTNQSVNLLLGEGSLLRQVCGNGICEPNETIDSCTEDCGFYGMEVKSVTGNSDQITINTTGATYFLERTTLEMWRRIDPATNTIKPRQVGTLHFSSDIGPLQIINSDKLEANISSTMIDFQFNSDSFFFIKAKQDIIYSHRNLIQNAEWNKGSSLDRMWTDGYGGSLHANITGNALVLSSTTDVTAMALSSDDIMSHMVFPPKKFDFEGLYGKNSRPFVHFVYDTPGIPSIASNIADYGNNGFGIFVIFSGFYDNGPDPSLVDSKLVTGGIMGYSVSKPSKLTDFIEQAHSNNFKVIAYFRRPSLSTWTYPSDHPLAGQHQDIEVTLQFMRDFQTRYNFDGWYLDNADVGSLLEDYNFMRQIRADIGNGIIYHHNTEDVWSNVVGDLKAIMVNAYTDYTLRGEWGLASHIDSPNDPYLRFYTNNYGLSQAYSSHKRSSDMKLAISEEEKNRTMAGLNALERKRNDDWLNFFKPFYDIKKQEYLSGNFNPDIDWPIDQQTGWFRMPSDIAVTYPTKASVSINWTTNELADSEVSYSINGVWWKTEDPDMPDGPVRTVKDPTLKTEHSITLKKGFNLNRDYEFRIRSNNGQTGAKKIIWGSIISVEH